MKKFICTVCGYIHEGEKNKISEDTTRLDSELFDLSIILGICEECIIIKSNLNKTNKSIEDIEKLIQDKNDIIQAITLNNREIRDIDNNIYNIKNSLNSFRNEKENINYNLNMITQYNTEYNEYKSKFEKIKVLKYHSTPTTGIQLMFIDMYISKILGAAVLFISYARMQGFLSLKQEQVSVTLTSMNLGIQTREQTLFIMLRHVELAYAMHWIAPLYMRRDWPTSL
jgi:hypothetical protein